MWGFGGGRGVTAGGAGVWGRGSGRGQSIGRLGEVWGAGRKDTLSGLAHGHHLLPVSKGSGDWTWWS